MSTIVQGKAQNMLGSPDGNPKQSTFEDLSAHRYTTERFGINDICYLLDGVKTDKAKVRPTYALQTYTLKAPMMTPIYKERDYFLVPREAILPLNWDKFYTQPTQGQDIDPTKVGTSVPAATISALLTRLKNEMDAIRSAADDADGKAENLNVLNRFLKWLVTMERIFSYGGLMAKSGCKLTTLYKGSFDKDFDELINKVVINGAGEGIAKGLIVSDGDDDYLIDFGINNTADGTYSNYKKHTLREYIEWLRDEPTKWDITVVVNQYANEITSVDYYEGYGRSLDDLNKTFSQEYTRPIDIAFFWAYQLVNAEFYTEDKVDYVYNANMYRQYVGDILQSALGEWSSFSLNGINYEYDYMSSFYFHEMVTDGTINEIYEYLTALLTLRRSLKYKDYFTGSKTTPLVTGEMTINPDAQGRISVIDVTTGIQWQRFTNAVRRYGRKIEEYAQGLIGGERQRVDFHQPLWLAGTRSALHASETENTAINEQSLQANAVTAKFEGFEGKYQFEFELDRQSIIIGITYYDIERSYGKGVKRMFMHVDRQDMYNPYLQYTGDQEIYAEEYDAANGNLVTFGYQPSYEEFKQDYNTADGGFMVDLPGYTFIDEVVTDQSNRPAGDLDKHIGPDFIRSYPAELDRFYSVLTGYSLATHKHFIIDYYNEQRVTRPMSYNPSIL